MPDFGTIVFLPPEMWSKAGPISLLRFGKTPRNTNTRLLCEAPFLPCRSMPTGHRKNYVRPILTLVSCGPFDGT